MKNKVYHILLLAACLLLNQKQIQAQCLFNGLNVQYCTNSAASTLTPGITGGTFSGPGISGSVFNPSVAGPGTHTITYSTCSATYAITQPAFAPTSTVGTGVALGDDQESGALPIGFTFKFFCTSYTNFYISSNGFIEFALTGNGCCGGQALPNNTTPNNLIAYCWNDLNPGSNAALITYTTIGTAPNRTLVVSFGGVPFYNGGGAPIYSQIKLMETSNIIEIHTTSIVPNGVVSTMGIENTPGNVGYPVTGRNGIANWAASNEAYRWTPGTACLVTNTTVVSPSTISVTASNPFCFGSTATVTALNNVTYTWSTASNASSITVSPTVNTTYTVSGTSAFGCNATSVITLTVNNTPTVNATASTGTACPNSPITLTGSGANTYAWTGGVTNAVVFNPTVSAIYTVTGTNACGSATAAISLSIHPIPAITASASNPTLCSGNSEVLSGGGGLSYTWTPNVTNAVAFFPTTSQNYTVVGTGAGNCTASAVQGVTVILTPSLTPIATPTSMCQGGTATLTAAGATGYTWTPGSSQFAPTLTVSPFVTTNYTITRTNGACANTSTLNLVIFPLPLLSANATPNQVCAGTGVNLVITGAITNTWLPGGFTSSNFTVFPNFPITYTVIGANNNCTASALVSVTVSPSPTLSLLTSTTTICALSSVTLTAGGALTFTWLPSNTSNTVEVFNPSATTLYTLSGTNSFGCNSSVSQVVVVNQLPNMAMMSNQPFICAGNSAILSFTNPSPNSTYLWNTGPTGTSIQVSPVVTTTYSAIGTNSVTGCVNTNSIVLSVYISTFAVTSPTAICKGDTAILVAVGPATSYSWNANGGVVSPSVAVSPVLSSVYLVTGTNGNCESTNSVSITVNPLPIVGAIATKGQICRLEVSTIVGSGATSYSWNTGATTQTISFTLSVTTTYTVTGTDVNGCSKTATVTQYVATCLGVDGPGANNDKGLNVYPNPNNGTFIISSNANLTLKIINTLGQVVSTVALSEDNKKEVTVSNLPNGIYFITGESNGLKINKKIIVEK